ncbi:lamin tail domain-containing protein [Rhodonellum sp.]|uniref:lamin tail domain-containing protein n=1 Tax=Rhodonellum sp. TaxID=2231180 RepID=UPI00271EB49C|nr:lamin tail domain-containing protein [Rhodonellum sp.]MDO9553714.1 lamin tail domain-containing protein [Rhodonellum sp.]
MGNLGFSWCFGAFGLLALLFSTSCNAFAQVQGFENEFAIVNHPDTFLPNWSANVVSASSSRVFHAKGEGKNGSNALAVQTIGSFNAEIFTEIILGTFPSPAIGFYAKTKQNGSGTRPVSVFLSFSKNQGAEFQFRTQVGENETFQNKNSEYAFFEIPIPQLLQSEAKLVVKIEVLYGLGSGSAARFLMDDFGLASSPMPRGQIRVLEKRLLNPFSVFLKMDQEIKGLGQEQVTLQGNSLSRLAFPTDSTFVLHFNDPIVADSQQIILQNVTAKNGDLITDLSLEIRNDTISLGEVLIVGPERIRLSFSRFFDPAVTSQTSLYQVNGRSPVDILLMENLFEVELLLDNPLPLSQLHEITLFRNKGTNGKESQNQKREIYYDDYLEAVFATDSKTIQLIHDLELDMEVLDLERFRIADQDFTFQRLEVPDDLRVLSLSLNREMEENLQYLFSIPPRRSRRGIWIPGSKKEIVWDKTSPTLVSAIGIGPKKLLLTFSEPIDPVFASMPQNYTLGGKQPESVILQENPSQVALVWEQSFLDQANYVLEISQIPDRAGNFIVPSAFPFLFKDPDRLVFKSLIINEVMAAPRDENILPNVEYIELLNVSQEWISLGGLSLANSRSATVLQADTLEPGGYVLLVSRTQASQFVEFGKVLGLTNWPTLLNAGDRLRLLDRTGNIVDSLLYSTLSYGGSAIAQGGYSLEIVNPYYPCHAASNLKPSLSPNRGTPGKINSVFDDTPDRIAPRLLQARAVGDSAVVLLFSKSLAADLAAAKLSFVPNLPLKNFSLSANGLSVIVTFGEELKEGTRYSIQVGNVRDCVGNLISPEHNEMFFAIPSETVSGDLILNEVLFNPRTGFPKFVEIYNASGKYLNLRDWKLANLDNDGLVANRRVLFHEDQLVDPFSYMVFTTDAKKLKSEYPKGDAGRFVELAALPSYPIAAGNVVFLNPDESIKEHFSYSDKMHHALLKESRGVSLERLSASGQIEKPSNWHSASASEGFATPGYKNSQVYTEEGEFGIHVQPKVFAPDALGQQNFTTISYKMEQSGNLATIRIYGIDGKLVKELAQGEIWGDSGFYTWEGTDQGGRKVRSGYYIVWVEIFDLNGNVSRIKKTVVVGSKF